MEAYECVPHRKVPRSVSWNTTHQIRYVSSKQSYVAFFVFDNEKRDYIKPLYQPQGSEKQDYLMVLGNLIFRNLVSRGSHKKTIHTIQYAILGILWMLYSCPIISLGLS